MQIDEKFAYFGKKQYLCRRFCKTQYIDMLFGSQIHDFIAWLPWVRARREQSAMRAIVEQRRRMMTDEEVQTIVDAINQNIF